ncbi:MAG: CsgG/HfaB family protein [Gammaproteobacteria bacterium]
MRTFRLKSFLLGSFFFSILAIATMPANADGVSGSAGGANSTGADSQLESCAEPLGTLAVHEDQRSDWWYRYYRRYPTLGSTTPLLRLMVQQSNCFVVVERGKAMKEVMGERELEAAGETREGSNFGKGQMVAADYTMSPEIQVSEETGGAKGKLFGKLGGAGDLIDSVAGKLKRDEASTTLLLIDNRSSVQIAAAQGTSKKFSFGAGFGIFNKGGSGGAASAFTKTPEGKVIAAAFANSYNNMVKALRNYKVQNVEGGLGKGGKLGVGE